MNVRKIVALLGLTLASGVAFGQACTEGSTIGVSPFNSGSVSLCGSTDQLTQTCANGTNLQTAPDAIFKLTLGSPSSAVFTVNGAGFNPYIALMSGAACNSNDSCPSGYENAGAPASNISLPSTSGLAAGTYFLVISDASAAVTCPNAGITFTLSSTGSLPVQLEKFSID